MKKIASYNFYMVNKKKGFSLVELIVVITIVTIMSSMALVSYSNYAKVARDSTRQETLHMISKTLEEFASLKGSYPKPDDYTTITYSGNTLWYQGVIGDSVSLALRISSKPRDPIHQADYSYSTTSNNTQYELSSILENPPSIAYFPGIEKTYANFLGYSQLKGTYNKLFVSFKDTATGKIGFISSPSITLSDLDIVEFTHSDFNTGSFVIDKGSNIAESYRNSNVKRDGNLFFTPKLLLEVTGNLTSNDFSLLMQKTKESYSGTIFISPVNVGGNTLWQSFINTPTSSDAEKTIGSYALEGLSYGSFAFVGNTPNGCNSVIYSGSLYSNYNITNQNHLQSQFFNGYTNIMSGGLVIGTNNFSIQATCNNGNLSYSNESKTLSCNSPYIKIGDTCGVNSCVGTPPANASPYVETTQSGGVNWSYASSLGSPSVCQYKCDDNYHTENGGLSCVANTQSVPCNPQGKPDNSSYINANVDITWNGTSMSTPANCSWTCNANYTQSGENCVPSTQTVSCSGSNPGTTASTLGASTKTIAYGDPTPSWTHTSGTPQACQYQCKAGYYYDGTICIASQTGYYVSSAGATVRTECGGSQYYCPNTANTSRTTVTAGYYTTGGTQTTRTGQTQCEVNNWCSGGVKTACESGKTSPAGSTSITACVKTCPSGFVLVPGNSTYNTTDFCVAKYEMTYSGNSTLNTANTSRASLQYDSAKIPISVGGNYPIANLNQTQAIEQCRKMGAGYHLITNNEWMTIVKNIESVADNWSGGALDTGGLYRGVTGESNTSTSLGCATANTTGLKSRTYVAGTLSTDTTLWGASKSSDCDSKRQHKLSNGNIIWDLSGNVWEHVDRSNNPNITTAQVGEGNLCTNSNYWHASSSGPTCTQHGPSSSYIANGSNKGMGYVRNSSGTDKIFLRGASASDGDNAGVFTLDLYWTTTTFYVHVGFRCAF